jgi:Uncharacterized protein conserved in bacteria
MKHVSSYIQNEALCKIQQELESRSQELETITNIIHESLPETTKIKFNIVNYSNNCVIIETSNIWLMWLKSYEQNIMQNLKENTSIQKIKWRVNPNQQEKKVAAKNNITLSQQSAKNITTTAKNIKNKALRTALLNIASRSK